MFTPWQLTPAQAMSRQAPFRHTAPGAQVTWPQSRVTQRPSLHVSLSAHVTPTQARCWHTVALAQTWSTPQLAAEQFLGRQRPVAQASVAAHFFPHAPQLASSTFMSTQVPEQSVAPVPHIVGPPASGFTGGAGQASSDPAVSRMMRRFVMRVLSSANVRNLTGLIGMRSIRLRSRRRRRITQHPAVLM
jgi:hypothetical protein